MFFVLSRAWDKKEILSFHEESNLRPSDSDYSVYSNTIIRLYWQTSNNHRYQGHVNQRHLLIFSRVFCLVIVAKLVLHS